MRAATGGLAARHNTIPPSISAPSAASVSRSTVRHHSLNGVGCAREVITSPNGVPTIHGLLSPRTAIVSKGLKTGIAPFNSPGKTCAPSEPITG